MYWPYVAPLCVITSLAMLGSGQMMRTAAAIFLNWALGTTFVMLTGIYDPWLFSLAIDAVAAFVILYPPAGKVQALIGWTYMAQIMLHVVYSFSSHQVGAVPYWQMLTAIAFVQLLLLGGWISVYWGRRYLDSRRDPGVPKPPRQKGVA